MIFKNNVHNNNDYTELSSKMKIIIIIHKSTVVVKAHFNDYKNISKLLYVSGWNWHGYNDTLFQFVRDRANGSNIWKR